MQRSNPLPIQNEPGYRPNIWNPVPPVHGDRRLKFSWKSDSYAIH